MWGKVILQGTASASASLSILGSACIILVIVRRGDFSAADVLLIILAVLDLGFSIACSIGQAFLPEPGTDPSSACYTQAIMIQFFGVASIIWVAVLSSSIVKSLRPGSLSLSARPTRALWLSLAATLAFSGGTCVVLMELSRFGDASLWCWISNGKYQVGSSESWVECVEGCGALLWDGCCRRGGFVMLCRVSM